MSVNGKNRRRSYVRRALCAALLGVVGCLFLPPTPAGGGDWPFESREPMSKREWDREMRKRMAKVSRAQRAYDKGKELFFQKKYMEAEYLFEEALHLAPEWLIPHSFLGQIFLEYHKDYPQAIYHLKIVAQNKSADGRQIALYYLAQAYAGAGQMRRAWETWQEYFKICTPGAEWETKAREYAAAVKVSLETETPPPKAAGTPSPSPLPASLSR